MNAALAAAVEKMIEEMKGSHSAIAGSTPCGGGCINRAEAITLADGRRFFMKSNDAAPHGMFAAEATGLRAIADAGAIRAPEVIGFRDAEDARDAGFPSFLLLENIESGNPPRNFMARFGSQLAEMHRRTAQARAGFAMDNFIGATPQANGWMNDWVAFWREGRLGPQLALAQENGLADARMTALGDKMMARLGDLIGAPDEPMFLLHGDLWGGNYLCDAAGEPVLIDPAAYYGRREADLAMTYLFGGFSGAFYAAYEEAWPLADGSAERLEIYKLYHLLNHLNLFGSGYYGACMATLQRFA